MCFGGRCASCPSVRSTALGRASGKDCILRAVAIFAARGDLIDKVHPSALIPSTRVPPISSNRASARYLTYLTDTRQSGVAGSDDHIVISHLVRSTQRSEQAVVRRLSRAMQACKLGNVRYCLLLAVVVEDVIEALDIASLP